MTEALAVLGVVVAWLGASITVLAEGRRGLGCGTALVGAGLCAIEIAAGHPIPGTLLLIGGAGYGAFRQRDGARGWVLFAPGSSPRMIAAVLLFAVSLFLINALDIGTPALAAILTVSALAVMRLTSTPDRAALASCAVIQALALGVAGSVPLALCACVVALLLALVPIPTPDAQVAP
ncbi:MAG: hypothetical protein J2P43_12325 [Candidatus Dormibacteraeota bacterium]|nr:hypothetical protein [Candidatus Dormibacteraeota bacterium]